jgi:hypothetical protein
VLGEGSASALRRGNRVFEVRTTDAAGNRDPTPATLSWKIEKN